MAEAIPTAISVENLFINWRKFVY